MNGSQGPGEASSSSWRQFTFFTAENVAHDEDSQPGIEALNQLRPPLIIEPTSRSSPLPASLIVASAGDIHLLDRHFQVSKTLQGWKDDGRTTLLREAGGMLIAVGEEGDSRFPVLKVWDLTRESKRKPALLRNVRIQHGQRPHPVSALALTSNLSHLAVGLADGTVILYRHFLQSLTTSPTSLTSLPKARIVHDASEPVTGLGFWETAENDAPQLAIVTLTKVLCVGTSGKSGASRTLDQAGGADLGCAVMHHDRSELLVARTDGLYSFTPEGRGPGYAYEGSKVSIHTHNHNVAVVMRGPSRSADASSSKLVIFDLRHRWIAYSTINQVGIQAIFSSWGGMYVRDTSGAMTRLNEHSTSAKLQSLFQRNLYTLAISLAQSEGIDESGMAEIHRQYGDHLYQKGDFDAAMRQYILTLGQVPPSYVVRKFLDAQRIQQLIAYLQALHAKGLANPNHTTLLLNCYTKTGDKDRLDQFLSGEIESELPFDLDTAIRVCRQAGFFEHASSLAKRWKRHEEYLRIQIEDAGEYLAALNYLRGLDRQTCEDNLLSYGATLLSQEPSATTDLAIDLCSGADLLKKTPNTARANGTEPSGGANVLSFLNVERVTGIFGDDKADAKDAEPPKEVEEPPVPAEPLPSPRVFFPLFTDHLSQFERFLETMARRLWHRDTSSAPTRNDERLDSEDQQIVWNTLLELYLTSRSKEGNAKALKLLVEPSYGLDPIGALMLCSRVQFMPGCLVIWEHLEMHEDVLRYWMELSSADGQGSSGNPSEEVIRYLDKHGPQHPELYSLALRYLSSSPTLLAQHSDQLSRILHLIDEKHVLPPLAVIQLLSRNDVTSIGVLRDWLREKVEETKKGIESDKHLVNSYRLETEQKQTELQSLADPAKPQVFQVTKCAVCGGQLDLPSVHFMCKHSYHQRCLSDSDPECIQCARQHSIIREVRHGQRKMADRHDLFLNEVHEAEDGFAVVAGAFGRGLMETAPV